MAQKYLDYTGLQTLWTKIKAQDSTTLNDAKAYASAQTSTLGNKIKDGTVVAKTATNATNATNDSDGNKITDTYIKVSQKATNNGVATLGADGKIPSSQLPSYVDDVLEYDSKANFPTSNQESGKIYVDKATNKTYRWGGSDYVLISASLALGETADTAYSGAKGKTNADNISKLQGYFDGGVAKETYKLKHPTSDIYEDFSSVHSAINKVNALEKNCLLNNHVNNAQTIDLTYEDDSNVAWFSMMVYYESRTDSIFRIGDSEVQIAGSALISIGKAQSKVGGSYDYISEEIEIHASQNISLTADNKQIYFNGTNLNIGSAAASIDSVKINGSEVLTETSMTPITTAELNTLLV